MKILKYNEKNFFNNLKKHINKRDYDNTQVVDKQVKKILNEVKLNGDSALLKYSKKFDNIKLKSKDLRLSNKIRKSYKNKIKQSVFNSFLKAINKYDIVYASSARKRDINKRHLSFNQFIRSIKKNRKKKNWNYVWP